MNKVNSKMPMKNNKINNKHYSNSKYNVLQARKINDIKIDLIDRHEFIHYFKLTYLIYILIYLLFQR